MILVLWELVFGVLKWMGGGLQEVEMIEELYQGSGAKVVTIHGI